MPIPIVRGRVIKYALTEGMNGNTGGTGIEPILLEKLRREEGDCRHFALHGIDLSVFYRTAEPVCMETEGNTSATILTDRRVNISYSDVGRGKGSVDSVNGAIVPPNTTVTVDQAGSSSRIYVLKMKYDARHGKMSVASPVGFTLEDISTHLAGEDPMLMMIPKNTRGERVITEGGGMLPSISRGKSVILGPENQFISASNSNSRQDFHYHNWLYEIFIPIKGKLSMFYPRNGKMQKTIVDKGDVLVVPPGLPHYAIFKGESPAFVFKESTESIVDEKVYIQDHGEISRYLEALQRAGVG